MMAIEQEWNWVRLILQDHQHTGNQISGGCICGFRGYDRSAHLDHLADMLCGADQEEEHEQDLELP
jgi:hypothetical protein